MVSNDKNGTVADNRHCVRQSHRPNKSGQVGSLNASSAYSIYGKVGNLVIEYQTFLKVVEIILRLTTKWCKVSLTAAFLLRATAQQLCERMEFRRNSLGTCWKSIDIEYMLRAQGQRMGASNNTRELFTSFVFCHTEYLNRILPFRSYAIILWHFT